MMQFYRTNVFVRRGRFAEIVMDDSVKSFSQRISRVNRRRQKMNNNGVVRKVGKDGLISAYPRRRMPSFPLRGIVILVMTAFLYKAVMFAWLGAAAYGDCIEALAQGTIVEQVGAWILQADPATVAFGTLIKPLLPLA